MKYAVRTDIHGNAPALRLVLADSLLTVEDGHVSVEERRIPYDAEALIADVRATEQYAAAIGDMRRPFARDTWEAAYAEWKKHAREWHPELFV